MQQDDQLDRVRLVEPQPGMPADQLPGLDQLLARTKRGKYFFSAVCFGILVAIGIATAGSIGPGLATLMIVGPAVMVYVSVRVLVATTGMAGLVKSPFTRVDIAPDGMRAAGKRVALQLPDGRWLVCRLGEPNRLLIAGLRRVWLLGPDARGRVVVLVPGNIRLTTARIRDTPPERSEPVPPAPRVPLRPAEDPVLLAHLKAVDRRVLIPAGVTLAIGAIALWAGVDSAIRSHLRSVGGMTAGFVFAFVMLLLTGQLVTVWFKQRKLLPPDAGWFELRVNLAAPLFVTAGGIATLTGYATLPDHSVHTFRARIDAALATNIAVTGQLWAIGPFRPGKPISAGLPGYPLIGQLQLGVR